MHEVVYWKVVVHRIFLVFLKTVITEFRYVFKSVANLLKLCNKEKKNSQTTFSRNQCILNYEFLSHTLTFSIHIVKSFKRKRLLPVIEFSFM